MYEFKGGSYGDRGKKQEYKMIIKSDLEVLFLFGRILMKSNFENGIRINFYLHSDNNGEINFRRHLYD